MDQRQAFLSPARPVCLSEKLLECAETTLPKPITDFARALVFSAIQSPCDGIEQLVNHVVGKEILPQVEIANPPSPAPFNSPCWHAQQIGGAMGLVVPFSLTRFGLQGIGSALSRVSWFGKGAEMLGLAGTQVCKLRPLAEGFATGFAMDFTMHPVSEKVNSFWQSRLINGTSGGLTFATLSASAHALEAADRLRYFPHSSVLFDSLERNAARHAISGALAGVVSAESQSLFSKQKLATIHELTQSAYGFAVVGGTLAIKDKLLGESDLNQGQTNKERLVQPFAEQSTAPLEGESQFIINLGFLSERLKLGQERLIPDPSNSRTDRGAIVGLDLSGLYIIDKDSSTGVFLNGERLKSGSKTYFQATDCLDLRWFAKDARWLNLIPAKVTEAPVLPLKSAQSVSSLQQTVEFLKRHRLKEPLVDGFEYPSGGDAVTANGAFQVKSDSIWLVVNREHDLILQKTIDFAKSEAQRLNITDPHQLARFLTAFARGQLKPTGMTDDALDQWVDQLDEIHAGKRILLGEFIKLGKGVCLQQAVLLKVLCDEMGLKATLVEGHLGSPDKPEIDHAWTHIFFSPKESAIIHDPRNAEIKSYSRHDFEIGDYVPGTMVDRLVRQQELSQLGIPLECLSGIPSHFYQGSQISKTALAKDTISIPLWSQPTIYRHFLPAPTNEFYFHCLSDNGGTQ